MSQSILNGGSASISLGRFCSFLSYLGELTGGPKIFLSYKRQDIERVEPIYEALRLAGFVPWMDVRDILPGGRWVEEIEKAIKSADFFLSFVSVNTVALGVPSQTGFSVNSERKLFNETSVGERRCPQTHSALPFYSCLTRSGAASSGDCCVSVDRCIFTEKISDFDKHH